LLPSESSVEKFDEKEQRELGKEEREEKRERIRKVLHNPSNTIALTRPDTGLPAITMATLKSAQRKE